MLNQPSGNRLSGGLSTRAIVLICLGLALVATAAIGQIWTHLSMIDYGYRVSNAAKTRAEIRERNRRLRVELAMLKRPSRVELLARRKFGLRPPEPHQLRFISPDNHEKKRTPTLDSRLVASVRARRHR